MLVTPVTTTILAVLGEFESLEIRAERPTTFAEGDAEQIDELDDTDAEPEETDQDTGDDEPDADDERLLGWSEGESLSGAYGSPTEDGENDLGWCENVGQLRLGEGHGDGDSTAPERHGGGFVRCGMDDAEIENEHGESTGH